MILEFFQRLMLATRVFWTVLWTGSVPVIEVWSPEPPLELKATSPSRIVMSAEHAKRTVLSE